MMMDLHKAVVLFGAEVASKTGLARVMRNSAMKMV
jgi:hypothetical protein